VVDYASAYLEQAWLLDCSKWLTASSLLKEDVTAEFTEWIAAVTPDELLDPRSIEGGG